MVKRFFFEKYQTVTITTASFFFAIEEIGPKLPICLDDVFGLVATKL